MTSCPSVPRNELAAGVYLKVRLLPTSLAHGVCRASPFEGRNVANCKTPCWSSASTLVATAWWYSGWYLLVITRLSQGSMTVLSIFASARALGGVVLGRFGRGRL